MYKLNFHCMLLVMNQLTVNILWQYTATSACKNKSIHMLLSQSDVRQTPENILYITY